MDSPIQKKVLFLFTKKFPFGVQETYLFNELPYLSAGFQKVVIIPYDEYDYDPAKNRLPNLPNVVFFELNKQHVELGLIERIKREVSVLALFFYEVIKGREPIKHLRNFYSLLGQLRHLYSSAWILARAFEQEFADDQRSVAYNYWLHRGVVLSEILKRITGCKFRILSRAHAYDLYHCDWLTMLANPKTMFLPFEQTKIEACDRIMSISNHGLRHFNRIFPSNSARFVLSRLGVNAPQKTILDDVREPSAPLLIMSCSGVDSRKRVYLIPSILAGLECDFKWVHFGGGKDDDIARLKAEILKLGLEARCELKGPVPHSAIITYYESQHVDLFINVSTAEGIPVSLMEAASYAVPMIATDTVGNPEIVDNTNGFLIPIDFNPAEVSALINAWWMDPAAVLAKRKAARSTFMHAYNASINYSEFVDELKKDFV